jgi:uncharacterized membrane protein
MRSLLLDIVRGLNTVYSGWILWNLFLAFVPLLISFRLFRKQAIAPKWFAIAGGITAAIGIAGLQLRLDRVVWAVSGVVRDLQAGNISTWLQVLWLGVIGVVALGISLYLSRHANTSKVGLWWIGLVAFIALLPNAPYVLTDVIHLIKGTSYGTVRVWVIVTVLMPLHFLAIILGFQAYVISLLNINYFLKEKQLRAWTVPIELGIHALCAVGIYLGRFVRLNSWDIVVDPTSVLAITLNTLTSKRPIAVIVVTFVILTVLYWVMKQITLGLKLRVDYARQGLDVLT